MLQLVYLVLSTGYKPCNGTEDIIMQVGGLIKEIQLCSDNKQCSIHSTGVWCLYSQKLLIWAW